MAEENLNEILKLRRERLKELQDRGDNPFTIESYDVKNYSDDIESNFEVYEEKTVSVAGRILAKRGHGKVIFMDLQDSKGRIQLFAKKDLLENFDDVKKLDIGDIVGVKGEVFKTQMGEISIRTTEIVLLSKSLQILPEKFHGLKDVDLRYRQRYVDLIVNPEVKDVFLTRTKILKSIRNFLDDKGYLEVDTPILSTVAGGANAKPFLTYHNALSTQMQMRIANELFLKRLIVGGFDKVYEMGKMFRNEGIDTRHNPEFTNIELYAAYEDYVYMMDLTEELFKYVATEVLGTTEIEYQGVKIDLGKPWKRLKMQDLIKEETGIDFDTIDTDEQALEIAREKGLKVEEFWTRGHVIAEIFEEFCEEKLVEPTFVIGHPVEISPLSKRNAEDPRITNRFELFINTWEFANAFSELNDPIDQKQRFEKQLEDKKSGDDEAHPMDTDFINALEVGLPPTAGLGIGIDRMIMLLTNQPSIRDIILFPTMKPEAGDHHVETKVVEAEDNTEEIIDFTNVTVEPLFKEYVDFETFIKSDIRAVKVLNCEEVPKSKKLLKFTLDDGSLEDRVILSGIKEYYNPEGLGGKTLLAIVNLPPRKMMGIESQGMILSCVSEREGKEELKLIMLKNNIPAGAKVY